MINTSQATAISTSTKNIHLDEHGDLTRYIRVYRPNYKRNEEPIQSQVLFAQSHANSSFYRHHSPSPMNGINLSQSLWRSTHKYQSKERSIEVKDEGASGLMINQPSNTYQYGMGGDGIIF